MGRLRARDGMWALVLMIGLGACQRGSAPITIAAAAPWHEGYMTMTRQGIQMAVDEVNARGGIGGRQVRVRWADDGASGVTAVAVAESLVADHDVLAVIGHANSAAMLAAARVYDGHLTAISPSATSPDLTGLSRWVFRVIPSDSTNGLTLARFATTLGAQRVAILYENDPYGRGLARAFRRSFSGTVVTTDPIDGAAASYEPHIAYLKELKPDVVFVASLETSGLALLREAKRQRFAAAFLASEGWDGVERDTVASEGTYVGAPFTAGDPHPAVRQFVSAFEAKYRIVPREDAALAYDATRLVLEGVRQRGATRGDVRAYLASLDDAHSFPGVTGALRFLPDGDPIGQPFVMTRIHRGTYEIADAH